MNIRIAGLLAVLTVPNAMSAFQRLDLVDVTASLPPAPDLPAGLRVLQLVAVFDGPGEAVGANRANVVTSLGNSNPGGGPPLGIEVCKVHNPGANFFQALTGEGASAGDFSAPNVGAGSPRALYDTFVSIGRRTQDPSAGVFDTTIPDPDFLLQDMDGVAGDPALGLGDGHDRIRGGWFNNHPLNLQGGAQWIAERSRHEVFLAQLSIAGLAAGSTFTEWTGDTLASRAIAGELTLALLAPQSGGVEMRRVVLYCVPSPGAVSLFAIVAVGARRRR